MYLEEKAKVEFSWFHAPELSGSRQNSRFFMLIVYNN